MIEFIIRQLIGFIKLLLSLFCDKDTKHELTESNASPRRQQNVLNICLLSLSTRTYMAYSLLILIEHTYLHITQLVPRHKLSDKVNKGFITNCMDKLQLGLTP